MLNGDTVQEGFRYNGRFRGHDCPGVPAMSLGAATGEGALSLRTKSTSHHIDPVPRHAEPCIKLGGSIRHVE
jgi:hypothetical protein